MRFERQLSLEPACVCLCVCVSAFAVQTFIIWCLLIGADDWNKASQWVQKQRFYSEAEKSPDGNN